MKSVRIRLIQILLIGAIFRAGMVWFFWDKPLHIVDEQHYQAIAENLYRHGEFSLEKGRPTAIRPPLYPAFLAAVYWMTGGINPNGVRVIQALIGLGVAAVVFFLGGMLFGERAGLWAALFFALYPSYVFFTGLVLTEALFAFLFLMFVLFSVSFLWKRMSGPSNGRALSDDRNVFLAGLFLGLSSLCRSILYPFPAVALVGILVLYREKLKDRGKWGLLLLAGFAVVVGPWTHRDFLLFGAPVVVGTMGGLNLYMGNYAHTPLNRAWAAVEVTGEKAWHYGHEKELAGMNEAQKQKWAAAKAKEFMWTHKLLTFKRSLIKAANFWGLERVIIGGVLQGFWPALRAPPLLVAVTAAVFGSYILICVLGAFGFSCHIETGRWDMIFILLLILYFTGMHALVFGHSRYHLPLMPLVMVFAGQAVASFRDIWAQRNRKAFIAALAVCLILFSVWVREIVFIEGARYLDKI